MKDIKGFEGRYSVTESGEVYSHLRKIILKGTISNGYPCVGLLSSNGKFYFKRIHVLVAEAFVPKPEQVGRLEVKHKDGIKTNNHYSNLEWVSHQRNIEHVYEIGLRRKYVPKARTLFVNTESQHKYIPRVSRETMTEICQLYDELKSLRKVAKEVGLSHETVRQAILVLK